MSNGILLIISSPSGGGKTTILKKVMLALPGLVFSVSHTTRSPRAGEENGCDYHFVTKEEFQNMQTAGSSGFLEWAEVHGNFYGTSKVEVDRQLAAGNDVILDIDVQGAMQVQDCAESVSIFIAPPSMEALELRLRGRGTESDNDLSVRLKNARQEISYSDKYDYLIINDKLEEAVESLRAIIIAERCRRRRSVAGQAVNLENLS